MAYPSINLRFCSIECTNNFKKGKTWEEIYGVEKAKEMLSKVKGKHNSPETEFKNGELHPDWIGGTEHYRGEDWDIQKQKVLERDNFECQRCKSKDALCVHHIIPWRESENNEIDNLVTLCRRCHIVIERKLGQIEDEDWIIIKHLNPDLIVKFCQIAENFNENNAIALKWCLEQALEYQEAKKLFFKIYELEGKINDIEANLSKLSPKEEIKEEIKKQVKTLGSK